MAVAFDAFTANANQTADFAFNHTPVGTPRAVIVWVVETGATADHIAGITYGGDAMTEVSGSPNILATGETGIVYCYFLGTSIPTGTQSVSVDTTATSNYIAYCVTLTAGADTEIVDSDGTINSTSITNPTATLSLSGKTSWAGIALHSGAQAVGGITPSASWTSRSETDRGATQAACYTFDTIGTSDVAAGWTQTTEDASAVSVAVSEAVVLFERAISESISISPAIARLKTANRTIAESISISPAVAEAALKFRTMADSISISDAIQRIKIFPRAIAESISISPAVTTIAIRVIAIAQSITISDSVTRLASFFRTISQSITLSDALEAHKLLLRQIAESISLSDSVVRMKTAVRTISESISISPAVAEAALKLRTIGQSISISDSIAKVKTAVISIPQSITINDSVTKVALYMRSVTQSITVSDSISRMKTAIRNINQSISISDLVERLFISGGGQLFTRTINETINISDAVNRTFIAGAVQVIRMIGGAGGRRIKRYNNKLKRYTFKMRRWFPR